MQNQIENSALPARGKASDSRTKAYVVLVLLFLFQMLNFFDKLVFGLSAVPIMQELSLSPKEFGLIGSSFFLLFSLSGTLVGIFVIGRVQTRWVLMCMALIWSVSQLPIFFSSSVAVIVVCRVILGAGEGPGLPTALHACYDWFPRERRSVPSAVVLQGISVGFLVGSPVLSYIIHEFGWRYGFLTCGLLGATWLVAWMLLGGEGPFAQPRSTEKLAPAVETRLPARVLWLDPSILGVMIMSTMSYWIVGMAATWLPPYLQLGLGYSPLTVGWIISAIYLFQSPLLLGASWVTQQLQSRGWSMRSNYGHASTLALACSGLALVLATQTAGVAQIVLIAIAFAAPSLTTIFGPVLISHVAPAAQRGMLVVVIYSANSVSGLLANYVTGWVVDMAGGDLPHGFINAMLTAGVVLLSGAVASLLLIFPERTLRRFAGYKATSEELFKPVELA
ncbi:MAG: MFS transporter [Azospirillum brasilense]|nr:MAG: MFS transporter [Azospirillum brasilense]